MGLKQSNGQRKVGLASLALHPVRVGNFTAAGVPFREPRALARRFSLCIPNYAFDARRVLEHRREQRSRTSLPIEVGPFLASFDDILASAPCRLVPRARAV